MCKGLSGVDSTDAYNLQPTTYKRRLKFYKDLRHIVDFIVIDNVTSKEFRAHPETRRARGELLRVSHVNVGGHRRNRAEKSIQLFQRAFLSTLASVPATFPRLDVEVRG